MSSDGEPSSPPTSQAAEDDDAEISDSNCDGEELLTPTDGFDGKGSDESCAGEECDGGGHTESVPSSPPTSVETPSKSGDHRTPSLQISSPAGGADVYRAPEVETEDEDGSENRRDYFPDEERYEASEDTFVHKGKVWESSSQWEDDEGEPLPSSSPPNVRQSPASSRKPAPALSSPLFPPRARQSQGSVSAKSALGHRLYTRPSPASRASSGSYDPRDHERKAPLVLLHITLLLLPGAEDIVLRHITRTTFERGLLVEHPRGDYNLLEEMILDGLGLEDDDYPLEEAAEEEESSWEKALNVPSTPGKKPWQLRVYASNGLMTPGAWKRVWSEMERIDVEIWPRGFDRTNKWGVGLSSPSSTIAAAMARGGSLSGKATSVTSPIPLELGSSSFVAADFDDIESDRNGLLTNRNSRRGSRSNNASGTSNPGKGNHSHNNSNSSIGILRRLSQPGTPMSPTANYSISRSSRRSKRRAPPRLPILDHFSVANAKFYLNKLTTPKAVKILAGINLLLFLYFTLFKSFVGVATNSISVNWFNYGDDDPTCSVEDDLLKVVEADMDGSKSGVGVKIPEGLEEDENWGEEGEGDGNRETANPDDLEFLEEDDGNMLPLLNSLDLEETIDDEAGESTKLNADDDSVPHLSSSTGDRLTGEGEGEGQGEGEGEGEEDAQLTAEGGEDSTSEDSDQFQFFLDNEPEKPSSSFPWSRWGDGLKDKLSF